MSRRDRQGVVVALMVGAVAAFLVAIYLAATWGGVAVTWAVWIPSILAVLVILIVGIAAERGQKP